MLKFLSLAILFLSLTVHAQKRTCELELYGPDPPVECETIIEDGEEIESCSAVGAPASRLILDASNPSYSESSELAEIGFYGYCRCSVKLWTRSNFRGLSLTYPFCRSNSNQIFTEDIWSRKNNSWRISCKF